MSDKLDFGSVRIVSTDAVQSRALDFLNKSMGGRVSRMLAFISKDRPYNADKVHNAS